ncbi:hypothetical protein I601_0550 [Nocardioides dokdonensis FR1436]|uniref:Uncharacterized protein n=1 Tax=Nocardioides dokdonensis FR1436 TaxID=1300347 RepID=A0A1A9GH90_9ACTN|nr:hypothetical protein [Nocardioides dokdonensis]ANH37002.1 hypothetical protein I601_0550 [Nocardioides dokdonensis FR1436]
MPPHPRRARLAKPLGLLIAAALGAVVLVGCEDDASPPRERATAPFTLPVGAPAFDPRAPAWSVGGTLHVGERTLELDPAPAAFVVTRWGVHYLADGSLWFSDGGPATLVARVNTTRLHLSPDGRHLGLMDRAHGPEDAFGTHLATPVVLDVATGDQVLRSPATDDLDDLDLEDLYEDAEPVFLGLDAEAAYVVDPVAGGTFRLPLDGADPETVRPARVPGLVGERGTPVSLHAEEGGGMRLAGRGEQSYLDGWLSPGGDALVAAERTRGTWYDAADGTAHRVDTGDRFFYLGGWVDHRTFYGAASARGSASGPTGRTVVVTCTLGERRCEVVGTEFGLPERPTLLFGTGSPALL